MKAQLGMRGLRLLLGLSLAVGATLAGPIVGSGSFNAGGEVFISTTSVDFGFFTTPPPGDQAAAILLPTTGVFSYLTPGNLFVIDNLNFASATITSRDIAFDGSVPDWITLPANTGGGLPGIDLSLTDIPINTNIPACTGTAADDVPGTSCRPSATSPLVLEQLTGAVKDLLSVAGDAYDVGGSPSSGTPYDGTLSSDFTGADGTISGWLGTVAANGSITAGYHAAFSTVPEPGTLPVLAAGLLTLGLIKRKKRSAT